jgi:hypothetical protein
MQWPVVDRAQAEGGDALGLGRRWVENGGGAEVGVGAESAGQPSRVRRRRLELKPIGRTQRRAVGPEGSGS